MSSVFKSAVAVAIAALAYTPTAFAANYTLTSGSALVVFSTNALQTLLAAGVSIAGTAPAVYTAPTLTFTASDSGIGYGANNTVTSATANGGLKLSSSTVAGAQILLNNIKIDTSGNVFADGVTSSWTNPTLGSYTGISFSNLNLFTSTLTGNTNIATGNGSIALNLANLKFASPAIPVLGNALGVPAFLQAAIFPTLDVGTASVNASFSLNAPAVPEASTWAMFGLGLAALGALGRRRSTQAA